MSTMVTTKSMNAPSFSRAEGCWYLAAYEGYDWPTERNDLIGCRVCHICDGGLTDVFTGHPFFMEVQSPSNSSAPLEM